MLNCVDGRDNDGVMNEEAIMLEEVFKRFIYQYEDKVKLCMNLRSWKKLEFQEMFGKNVKLCLKKKFHLQS